MSIDTTKLSQRVQQWQERLLQLDRRNRLLNYRPDLHGLQFADPEIQPLLSRLERAGSQGLKIRAKETRPARPAGAGEANDSTVWSEESLTAGPASPQRTDEVLVIEPPRGLAGRLRTLWRAYREFKEEQGLDIAYIAVGLVRWYDEADPTPALAPLLLVPARLIQDSPLGQYRVVVDELSFEQNYTLELLLRQRRVEFPLLESIEYLDEWIDQVKRLLPEEWEIEKSAHLSNFQYSKIAMWEDLEKLRGGMGIEHPIVRALALGEELPSQESSGSWHSLGLEDLKGGRLDSLINPSNWPTVLDADYSQLQAIGAAIERQYVVIHGPPGTGKSQTIANIIALAMAMGKTVLFVSEKTAALDVVKRRLEHCGLGRYCLDLHSDRATKASVYAQLRAALAGSSSVSGARFSWEDYVRKRDRLNAYVEALHSLDFALGRTPYEVHGELANLGVGIDLNLNVPAGFHLDRERFEEICDLGHRAASLARPFRDHFVSPWNGLRIYRERQDIAGLVGPAIQHLLDAATALETVADVVSARFGFSSPRLLSRVDEVLEGLEILRSLGVVPQAWADPRDVPLLMKQAHDAEKLYRELHACRESASKLFDLSPSVDWRKLSEVASGASIDRSAMELFFGNEWERCLFEKREALVNDLDEFLNVLAISSLSYERAATIIGRTKPVTIVDWVGIFEDLVGLAKLTPVPSAWLPNYRLGRQGNKDHVGEFVQRAREVAERIALARNALETSWLPGVRSVAAAELRSRFRSEHSSLVRRLFSRRYKKDLDAFRVFWLSSRSLRYGDVLLAFQRIEELERAEQAWTPLIAEGERLLGDRFRALETDWAAVGDEFSDWKAACQRVSGPALELATSEDGALELKRLAEQLDSHDRALEQALVRLPGKAALFGERLERVQLLGRDLLPQLRRIAGVLNEVGPYMKTTPRALSEFLDALTAAARCGELEQTLQGWLPGLQHDFGPFFRGSETDWEDLERRLRQMREAHGRLFPRGEGRLLLGSTEDPSAWSKGDIDTLRRRRDEFAAAAEAIQKVLVPFGEEAREWTVLPLERIKALCARAISQIGVADDFALYLRTKDRLAEIFCGYDVVGAIREKTDLEERIVPALKYAALRSYLESIYRSRPVLAEFRVEDFERWISEFQELDAQAIHAARAMIAHRLADRLQELRLPHMRGQMTVLNRELQKKQRNLPVRQLLKSAPKAISIIKPCFMMSPLAVSQFLERSDAEASQVRFDMVIFDEASQIFPEDAIPALLRAESAVVVGDDRQLPPTSFFRRLLDQDQEENWSEDAAVGDVVELGSVESILRAFLSLGPDVDQRWLSMHYRSYHEDLINFSNRRYYDGRLLVFPSPRVPGEGHGVRFVHVPDGRYDAGGSRTNRQEAERVVELVFELFRRIPREQSVGVVAMSRAQADLIEELIESRRASNREFEFCFNSAKGEPFFVKNLENVQGDERDHIVLSVGYGPTVESGQVLNRFGPLNDEKHGWRRLNVAVSRARRSLTVVSSMFPEQISGEGRGARELRAFLAFARDPRAASGEWKVDEVDGKGLEDSPFEAAVAEALRGRGYEIAQQVGVAGFRIDIAIWNEHRTGFLLGIECDGATYHSAPSARDRDRIRQAHLEALGWRIHRVWSTAWWRNPGKELERIEHAIAAARAVSA